MQDRFIELLIEKNKKLINFVIEISTENGYEISEYWSDKAEKLLREIGESE